MDHLIKEHKSFLRDAIAREHRIEIQEFQVIVVGDELSIPYRLYTDILLPFRVTETQKLVWSCLYTRMSNGYTREKYLKEILLVNEPYVVPFVVQLCGEYVYEILSIIHQNLNSLDMILYKDFFHANPEYISKTKQRIGSYRNCYFQYEKTQKQSNIGYEIMQHIEQN